VPEAIVAQPVRQLQHLPPDELTAIPWGHNVVLLQKLKSRDQRLWYARQTVEHGWSRSLLVHWIESDLYSRQGRAITNFDRTLPPPQSDLAKQLLKDPYNFDFLTLAADAAERDLEKGLLDHVQRFLLELGAGFAFVGRQVALEVEGEGFSIDLLFFHLRLRCFVVVDLKTGEFKPEFSGKMNFYLSAVDDLMRHPVDNPSIGLILCKTAKKTVAEYALRDLAKPVGVARYVTKLVEALPDELAGALPTIEQIERELAKEENRLGARKPPA
jgi:predicted nuclease of restriction endonuclease-like (RecB) superfamily